MDLSRVSSLSEAITAKSASPRLENAAHQFEASLLTELLKPMREQSEFSDKDEEDDDSSADGSMREYGTEAMAECLSEHGGIGIAKMVLAKLAPVEQSREQNREQNNNVQSGEENRLVR
jgi:flagellar protein FlgJ